MTIKEMKQLQEIIKETVKTTVNGKIDRIDSKLDAYIVKDNERWATAQPAIDLVNNTKIWSKINSKLFAMLIGLSTIIVAVYEIIKIKVGVK